MPAALGQQIANDLRAKIESGQLAPGQRLKPEIELSKEYTATLSQPISIETVRDAIALLISTGLVEKRHGGATFVAKNIDLARYQSTSDPQGDEVADYPDTAVGQNRELATTLAVEINSADAAPELELHGRGMVISRHEQHSIDGKSYSIKTSFYPMGFAAAGAVRLLQPNAIPDGVPTYIRTTLGINQVGYRETCSVRVADSAEAMSFEFPAKSSGPVFEVRHIAYDEAGRPIWLTVTVYAADRNQIEFEEGKKFMVAPVASPADSDMSKHPSALSVDQPSSIFVKKMPLIEKLRAHRRVKPYSMFKDRTLNEPARLNRVQICVILGLLLPQLYQWISFPALPKTHATGSFNITISILIVITSIGLLLSVRDTVLGLVLGLAYMFASLLYTFSVLYWGYGSKPNFSIPLSHLDAVYFAIGTLTTAGTGNISPTSDLTRGLQAIQMILGFVIVVFAVALIIPRLIEYGKRVTIKK